MATAIGVPTDNKVLQILLTHLIRDKPTNMGASTEKIYGLVKDHDGNLRIPLGIAKMIWQALPIKKLHELPRKHIPNTIALGEDGRDYQIPTYETLVQHMINTHMAYLSLYCGAGKTIIASKLICEMGVITGVVTDSIVIFPQWIEVFKKRTGAVVVGIDKPVDKLPPADVYIFMVSACSKMHPSVLAHIQLLVVDEALYFMTPTRIPALLNFTPSYSLGLCAEIKRDDGMHCYLPYFFGPQMIRRISTKPFTVYRVETPYKPEIQFARYKIAMKISSISVAV
jgi:superfamily II DNA or RNA helicase